MLLCIQAQLRMKKYDELREQGVKNPCAEIQKLNLKAYFRCCVYKWQKVRKQEMWPTICAVSPRLAKQCKEVPNHLRRMLGLKDKFTKRATSRMPDSTTILPTALETAVAELVVPCSAFVFLPQVICSTSFLFTIYIYIFLFIYSTLFFDVYIFTHAHAYMRFFGMKNAVLRNQCHPPYFPGFLKASVHSKAEHVNRGEECSYQFVKQTLKQAIEHWNDVVGYIRGKNREELLEYCELPEGETDVESHLQIIQRRISEELLKVSLKDSTDNFLPLGGVVVLWGAVFVCLLGRHTDGTWKSLKAHLIAFSSWICR